MRLNQKQLKKLAYQFSLLLLTTGASLILGFLSFGGMLALWPVIPVAAAAFALSVAYEGEIYLQNITSALKKLFKHDFLKRQVAKTYLLEKFPFNEDQNRPAFFNDYEAQLRLLHRFDNKRLDKDSQKRKKQIKKTLKDMEKWFAIQLFQDPTNVNKSTKYEKELLVWLAKNDQAQAGYQSTFIRRQYLFQGVKAFSALAGVFMGFGTTYLLVEAFTSIPFLAAIPLTLWPVMIVPMSIIAGAAYGLLTYNAVTDMISNNTLSAWYDKIHQDLQQGLTFKNLFMVATSIVLLGLALCLTICTAGTWWTVIQETRPLFNWMSRMPSFIMGVINPLITGLSAVAFNLQNTSETLELIDEGLSKPTHEHKPEPVHGQHKKTVPAENMLQKINPARILLKLTFTPIRILLFLGHLISIAVTADRVPGMSQTTLALLGFISEGFEDAHYFFEQSHHHDTASECSPDAKPYHLKPLLENRLGKEEAHSHDNDLPTRILTLAFTPVFLLAAGWDYMASKLGSNNALSFTDAWNKQHGIKATQSVELKANVRHPSEAWQREHAVYRIERHKQKQLSGIWVGQSVAQDKYEQLTRLQETLKQASNIRTTLEQDRQTNQTTYGTHRFFASKGQTATEQFLQSLPERVTPVA